MYNLIHRRVAVEMTLLLLCRFILLTGNKTHREQGHSIFCCAFIVTIQ